MSEPMAPRGRLIIAFAAVYLIWGSTYLAIRYAIETIPPFLMAASRFLMGGVILYSWSRSKGAIPFSNAAWKAAAVVGFFLLLMGNGAVVIAEQWVPSGLTALLIATTPMWVSIVDWLRPDGKRPRLQVAIGILTGMLGVSLLIDVGELRTGGVDLAGAGILMVGSISWAIGSLHARYVKLSASPIMTSSMQMLCGGIWLLLASAATGEFSRLDIAQISRVSLIAYVYLAVFGSIIAFTAYSWLVTATTPARAATYAYVNPAVAVFLGWAVAGEPLTARMMVAMAIIVGAVVVITNAKQ